jgi:hypothetical protein
VLCVQQPQAVTDATGASTAARARRPRRMPPSINHGRQAAPKPASSRSSPWTKLSGDCYWRMRGSSGGRLDSAG